MYGVDPGGVGEVPRVTNVISIKIFGSGSTLLSVSSDDSSSDELLSEEDELSSSASSGFFSSSTISVGSGENI